MTVSFSQTAFLAEALKVPSEAKKRTLLAQAELWRKSGPLLAEWQMTQTGGEREGEDPSALTQLTGGFCSLPFSLGMFRMVIFIP